MPFTFSLITQFLFLIVCRLKMNAEGLNTSHKEEGDANDTAKLLGESESKYVDEGDEKTTGNPGEDTKVLNVEPKTEEELLFCKFCEFQAKNLTVNDFF